MVDWSCKRIQSLASWYFTACCSVIKLHEILDLLAGNLAFGNYGAYSVSQGVYPFLRQLAKDLKEADCGGAKNEHLLL